MAHESWGCYTITRDVPCWLRHSTGYWTIGTDVDNGINLQFITRRRRKADDCMKRTVLEAAGGGLARQKLVRARMRVR